jgi:hypothetical protein
MKLQGTGNNEKKKKKKKKKNFAPQHGIGQWAVLHGAWICALVTQNTEPQL